MPLSEEQKRGLLQNTTVGMHAAQKMFQEAAKALGDEQSDIVAALSVQNLLIATFAQAFLLNLPESLILQPGKLERIPKIN